MSSTIPFRRGDVVGALFPRLVYKVLARLYIVVLRGLDIVLVEEYKILERFSIILKEKKINRK